MPPKKLPEKVDELEEKMEALTAKQASDTSSVRDEIKKAINETNTALDPKIAAAASKGEQAAAEAENNLTVALGELRTDMGERIENLEAQLRSSLSKLESKLEKMLKDGDQAVTQTTIALGERLVADAERRVAECRDESLRNVEELKMTVLKIDPKTHQMSITDGPRTLSRGKSMYVGAINVPFAPEIPHTYTFFDSPGEGVGTAQVCRVSELGRITECAQRPFAGYDIPGGAISGQLLWDGRLIFAFATKTGEPYYIVEALFAGHAPDEAHITPPKVPTA